MKLTAALLALLIATQAHAITAPDPTPDPTPEASEPEAAPGPDGQHDGSTACEHYPSGECPGVWVNPAPVTDQKYRGNGKGGNG